MEIEIITTPNEKLKETGFGSDLSCLDVMDSIAKMGHIVKLTICQSSTDLKKVLEREPDLVVLGSKYMVDEKGEEIWFSEFFADNQMPFSGSLRETLAFDSDKVLAKEHLNRYGINTAKFFMAAPGQYLYENELPLPFPLFLKPADAANGNGIDDESFVRNFAEFQAKVQSLHDLYLEPVLVEEYLSGQEFTVAIIKTNKDETIVSAMEIIPPESKGGLRILGSDVKKNDTENFVKIDARNLRRVEELALSAFFRLGVRGYGRIDIKMDKNGKCYFMEANLVPGMNPGSSYFPMACEIANGIQYDDVVKLMLSECIGRVPVNENTNTLMEPDSIGA